MFNFETLEKKCKKYYFKRWIKLYLPIFILILVSLFIIYIFQTDKDKKVSPKVKIAEKKSQKKIAKKKTLKIATNSIEKNDSIKQTTIVQNKLVEKKHNSKISNRKCYAIQLASMSGVKLSKVESYKKELEEKYRLKCYYKKKGSFYVIRCNITQGYSKIKEDAKRLKSTDANFMIIEADCSYLNENRTKIKPIQTHTKPDTNDTNITNLTKIKEPTPLITTKKIDIVTLKELFRQRNSYGIALKLAKLYYEKGDYKNSYVWSKKANFINKEDEEAWIINAKSLYKLGDKSSAKELLKFYLQFKTSKKISELLKQWSK